MAAEGERGRRSLEWLFKLVGVLVLLGSFLGGWLVMSYRDFLETPLAVPGTGVIYDVAPGTSLRELADDLHRRGVVAHPRFLVWLGRRSGQADRLRAGEYRLSPGLKPAGLLDEIVAGRVVQHALTLVEGWTFRQVLAAVEQAPALTHTLRGLDDAAIMARLGHPGESPEGRFFPDTYHFPRGTTDAAFLERAYDAMAARLQAEWARRAPGLPLKTPYQALILASIVEKETAVPREREEIAGVFVRRLERGMRLQTDPTVIFGLGAAYHGDITFKDLREDTPYNTYTRAGLPPTPIALPSAASLHAVLHPAAGDSLYFVARGDGTHQFSRTLAEHNRAVQRYQLKGRPFPRPPADHAAGGGGS